MLALIRGSTFLCFDFEMIIDFFLRRPPVDDDGARFDATTASYFADPGFEFLDDFLPELIGLLLSLSSYPIEGTFICEVHFGLRPSFNAYDDIADSTIEASASPPPFDTLVSAALFVSRRRAAPAAPVLALGATPAAC